MVITHNREKLINAIIYFANNTKYCGKTKLMKLLYFLDFCHFKQTGKSVTGLEYFAWEKGPVPKVLFEEITHEMKKDLARAVQIVSSGNFQKIVSKKNFDDRYFTNREKKILEDLSFIFKDAMADDMVESTHFHNLPWNRTIREKGERHKIDYLLSIDDSRESLSYDEAKERMEEISEVYNLFGAS
jgi:uncharacterized phage-associated protein